VIRLRRIISKGSKILTHPAHRRFPELAASQPELRPEAFRKRACRLKDDRGSAQQKIPEITVIFALLCIQAKEKKRISHLST